MHRHLAEEIERVGGVDCEGQPDLFFPEDITNYEGDLIGSRDFETKRLAIRTAKALCASCPLQKLCLDTALANDEHWGIWGGLTGEERAILRRRLKSAGKEVPHLD